MDGMDGMAGMAVAAPVVGVPAVRLGDADGHRANILARAYEGRGRRSAALDGRPRFPPVPPLAGGRGLGGRDGGGGGQALQPLVDVGHPILDEPSPVVAAARLGEGLGRRRLGERLGLGRGRRLGHHGRRLFGAPAVDGLVILRGVEGGGIVGGRVGWRIDGRFDRGVGGGCRVELQRRQERLGRARGRFFEHGRGSGARPRVDGLVPEGGRLPDRCVAVMI
mmetsp:Transcript_29234/g.62062  ORF Transcript_29234/g.62062 Transcript_29234/m.62062 type:complete len:222 (-) Transcript_29234:1012-1677(-)